MGSVSKMKDKFQLSSKEKSMLNILENQLIKIKLFESLIKNKINGRKK